LGFTSLAPTAKFTMPEPVQKSQRHPQENVDRLAVDLLMAADPNESMSLVELARLRIRYRDFPGAASIQQDLDRILAKWQLSEEELFTKTRAIHEGEAIYQVKAKKNYEVQEDWT
jgi:hypothetical protein